MAPIKFKCKNPACHEWTEEAEPAIAIELLKLHTSQVHGVASKPDKPRRPELHMTGDAVEDTDWERFVFQYEQYKKLAGINSDASSHLLACLSTEVYNVLFATYGRTLTDQTELQLQVNIRRLVVRQRNSMANVMSVLRMTQDSDQAVLNVIAQLKAAARLCDFKTKCECGKEVDFADILVLYKLVAGVSDMELQEEMMIKPDLTLAEAEKMAVLKESAKFSQAAMSGESTSTIRSSYKQLKAGADDIPKRCSACGASKNHLFEDRESIVQLGSQHAPAASPTTTNDCVGGKACPGPPEPQ